MCVYIALILMLARCLHAHGEKLCRPEQISHFWIQDQKKDLVMCAEVKCTHNAMLGTLNPLALPPPC